MYNFTKLLFNNASQKLNYITVASKYRNLNSDSWTDTESGLGRTLIATWLKCIFYKKSLHVFCLYELHLSILIKAWNTMDTIQIRRFQADSVHINLVHICITFTVVIHVSKDHKLFVKEAKLFFSSEIWEHLLSVGTCNQKLRVFTCSC